MDRRQANLAILLALLAGACSVDVGAPEGIVVACASDSECPKNWVCRPATQRCSPSNGDREVPAVLPESVRIPGRAAPGREIAVSFAVSEPLFALPAVHLAGDDASWSGAATGELAYRFTYIEPATGSDRTAAVVATLVDLAGNVATNVALGSVVLDHQPPGLVGDPILTPEPAPPAATLTLALSADER